MNILKISSIILAIFSIIMGVVGMVLHAFGKLRPTRRLYRDNPQVWVFYGFWSFVLIHYALVYVWWFSDNIAIENNEYQFTQISQRLTNTVKRSRQSLELIPELDLFSPIDMAPGTISNNIVAVSGIGNLRTAVDICMSNIDDFQKVLKPLGTVGNKQCGSNNIPGFTNILERVDKMIAVLENLEDVVNNEKAIEKIGSDLMEVVSKDNLGILSKNAIQRSLDVRMKILDHFDKDLGNIENRRKTLVEALKPKTLDKIELIKRVTFAEFIIALIISSGIYIGFKRPESVKRHWHVRFCSTSVQMSGANLLIIAVFILRLSYFKCPDEVEKINIDYFTTECESGQHTFFNKIQDETSIDGNLIAEKMKDDILRIESAITALKMDLKDYDREIIELKEVVGSINSVENGCVTETEKDMYTKIGLLLSELVDECEKMRRKMEEMNQIFDTGINIIQPILDELYIKVETSLISSIDAARSKMAQADIACRTIRDHIVSGRTLICAELNVDLGAQWLVLDTLLVLLSILFVLNSIVYRTISLWKLEEEAKENKKKEDAWKPVKNLKRNKRNKLSTNLF